MPFFIARLNASGRVVTVDQSAHQTREAAEDRATPRSPGEQAWVIEAEHSKRAALQASRTADAWKPGMIIAERLEPDRPR
jgi:ferric-dicitrate binding protein FerR (iron transport regulator)